MVHGSAFNMLKLQLRMGQRQVKDQAEIKDTIGVQAVLISSGPGAGDAAGMCCFGVK